MAHAAPDDIQNAIDAYEDAREAYERTGGEGLHARASAMLDALGLAGRGDQLVGALSGGEKNVLSLTQALLAEPDLLVLDEPGNHLDFAGIAWLEEFLARFRGAVLLISHNRYLLDRVVGGILHLEDGRVDSIRRQLLRVPCDGPAREARAARRLRRRPEAARAA